MTPVTNPAPMVDLEDTQEGPPGHQEGLPGPQREDAGGFRLGSFSALVNTVYTRLSLVNTVFTCLSLVNTVYTCLLLVNTYKSCFSLVNTVFTCL